jgi:hypothetical protein
VSSRIETTSSPARLLRELPAGWAQTILTSPSRQDLERSPGVISELHRVLRNDGTFWLLCADKGLPCALAEHGWIARRVDWATPLRVDPAGRARLHLFVKQPRYHYNTRAAQLFLAPRTHTALMSGGRDRRHTCAWSPSHRRQLLRLCILAGSSRTACRVCGAPYTRTGRGGRRPTCGHDRPGGRCLVLDPFYHPGAGTRELAERYGSAFLGITAGGHA